MATVSIPLHSRKYPGLFAIVDDEDASKVAPYRWYPVPKATTVYARTEMMIDGCARQIGMHRFVSDAPAGMDVDHWDGNGLNNQRANLRVATRTQNMQNQRKHRRGTNHYKGVWWDKHKHKWRAEICVNAKRIGLGRFDNEEDAARAYDKKAIEAFGEFARINFTFQGTLL